MLQAQHLQFTWYHSLLLLIIITIWRGYFSVNPILGFGSLKVKKSVVLNVVMAAK